jgi:hypothetical protein
VVLHLFGTIEVEVPPEWSDQSVLTLVREESSSKNQTLRRNFVITRAPFDGTFTLEDLARGHFAALTSQVPNISLVREELIEIDGLPAFTREIRFPTPQHGLAQQLHVFHIRGDTAYTMVGIGSAGVAFEPTRQELLAIVKSFRVKDQTKSAT